ncbi:hypothetical protein YC2023_033060 [Brassica napus]
MSVDAPRFEHRPAWIMDTAQGGDLVSQLDPTEVLPSDRAEHTDRVIPSVHSVLTDNILPSERADQTVRTIPSDHPDCTARVVHRIDPHTSRIELSLEPRPRDGIYRPTSLLSRPSRQDKTDTRARIHLGCEESKDGRRFFLIALFVRPACPERLKESQAVQDLSHDSTHLGQADHPNVQSVRVERLAGVWIIPRVSTLSFPPWTSTTRMNIDSSLRVILTGLHQILHLDSFNIF